ncbi:MAG TPA: FAD-dependent oxidoreductase, partial [Acidimicrobiales bacterium]|nr:FAD-dependent oxidoreductase [Acidimicrobiales bacterium]
MGSGKQPGRGRSSRHRSRYSALHLLRHGLSHGPWPRAWRHHELRPAYDVVIVGAGVHGLATAYYLAANHGITNVAVIDKGY